MLTGAVLLPAATGPSSSRIPVVSYMDTTRIGPRGRYQSCTDRAERADRGRVSALNNVEGNDNQGPGNPCAPYREAPGR